MTQEMGRGYLLADEPREDMLELEAGARRILLDAAHPTSLEPDGDQPPDAGLIKRQADYLLSAEDLGDEAGFSRYMMARIAGHGLQLALADFRITEESRSPLSTDGESALESVNLNGEFRIVGIVNFFAFDMAPALRVEGVETLAGEAEVEKMLETVRHPRLAELDEDAEARVRHVPVVLAVMESAQLATAYAQRYFVARKIMEVATEYPKGSAERSKLEARAAALKAERPGDPQ